MTLSIILIACVITSAQSPDPSNWPQVQAAARGQTVYFHAWGGEPRMNRYLLWAASQLRADHGFTLEHIKLTDTSEAVSRILAEKQAGNTKRGTVDLLWVNGENFAALKESGLLYGPWAEALPNFPLVDADHHPEMRHDFTVPVEGMESPWLRAQLVFYYDSDFVTDPPRTIEQLLEWSKANPAAFTYPRPPAFLGSTFLKQALLELVSNPAALYQPMDAERFEEITAPLWTFLDTLHPNLLRRGRYFPANGAELRRLMADGETTLAFSFNPREAEVAIADGELPPTVRSYILDRGTLANISFVAIPFNATHKAAALVTANFLLSPEAQAHAAALTSLAATPVIAPHKLSAEQRALFEDTEQVKPGPTLPEPHTSWTPAIERAWLERYSGH